MGRGDGQSARADVLPAGRGAAVSPAVLGEFKRQLEYRAGDPGYVWHLMAVGLYKNSNLGLLATREAFQNSIDAIKRAMLISRLGREGKSAEEICRFLWPDVVDPARLAANLETVRFVLAHPIERGRFEVEIDPRTGTLVWRDNGVGMNDAELQDNFLSIGGSGKRDDPRALGGFGVAKAVELG